MNGIYIHIPFCKSKCYYCDFYSVTSIGNRNEYITTLFEELAFRNQYLNAQPVDSIYFGGGTPTLLSSGQLDAILHRLQEEYEVENNAEVTLEANPDDLNPEVLAEYLKSGFNRISIGIQSFVDDHLQLMNRRHTAAQAVEAVKMAGAAGFSAISLDLIYGIPGMTEQQWKNNLIVATGLPADHISAYHLTLEPGTPFGKLQHDGKFSEITEDQSLTQYRILLDMMGNFGFEQYEISNFARHQQYSRHNSKYWTGDSYIGLGPSAHSFNGTQRHWNPSSLIQYTDNVKKRKPPEGENIDAWMKRNEYIMTRLRTSNGIDATDFTKNFGEYAWNELLLLAGKHIKNGRLIMENGRIWFNRVAWFQSDGILADLFVVR